MKVLNLRCAHGHGFEGWFGSEQDFVDQTERRLVECPMCGDAQITRLPTAARLSRASTREPKPAGKDGRVTAAPGTALTPRAPSTPEQQGVEAMWLHAVRHVMAHTEDVGERFPDEARRIHYGEVPQRGIRGQANAEQTEALRDEGIEVHALPVPKALKGPVQ